MINRKIHCIGFLKISYLGWMSRIIENPDNGRLQAQWRSLKSVWSVLITVWTTWFKPHVCSCLSDLTPPYVYSSVYHSREGRKSQLPTVFLQPQVKQTRWVYCSSHTSEEGVCYLMFEPHLFVCLASFGETVSSGKQRTKH